MSDPQFIYFWKIPLPTPQGHTLHPPQSNKHRGIATSCKPYIHFSHHFHGEIYIQTKAAKQREELKLKCIQLKLN